MKKISYLSLAAAGLLLGACSSDDAVVNNNVAPDFTDGAYVAISIANPAATRANEDVIDGEEAEAAVKNASLLIFKGANENDAVFQGSYPLAGDFDEDGSTYVTSTSIQATQIDNQVAADIVNSAANVNFYAYVIVNRNGQVNDAKLTNVTFADFKRYEFTEVGAEVNDVAAEVGDGGLLMTNSPVANVAGGTNDATSATSTTLVALDKTKVFATKAAATAAPAACVYVERAAAKVTLKDASTGKIGDTDIAFEIEGWQIINTEPTYYNTRQVDDQWNALNSDATAAVSGTFVNPYRFVSANAFNPTLPSGHGDADFRTMFAQDPQYGDEATLNNPSGTENWVAADKAIYTIENTFDVDHQQWGNTTQALLKVKLNNGQEFFTINGGSAKGDAIVKPAELNDALAGYAFNDVPAVEAIIKQAIAAATEEIKTLATDPLDEITVNINSAFTANYADGAITYDINWTVEAKDKDNNPVDWTTTRAQAILDQAKADVRAALNGVFTVNNYKNGNAYYLIRIQHFGEYETPWSAAFAGAVVPGATIDQIYGTDVDQRNKRFLGRYGVVRDNIYNLEVAKIGKIGYPKPIDLSGDGYKNIPDDEIQSYISVHVHILPWVVRNQSVEL